MDEVEDVEAGLLVADGLAEPPPQGFGKGEVFSEPRCGLLAAGVVVPVREVTNFNSMESLYYLY